MRDQEAQMARYIPFFVGALVTLFSAGITKAAPTDARVQPGKVFDSPTTADANAISKYLLQFEDKTLDYCLDRAAGGDSDANYCAALKLRERANTGDAVAAVARLRAAAEAGNLFAQNDLGSAYLYGKGVPRDYQAAFKWFMRSAEAGLPHAMVSLGWQYMCGLGVPIDYAEARRWNRLAAEWGNSEGANNLGWLYESGSGGPSDIDAAKRWYAMAANMGNEDATDRLANLNRPAKLQNGNTNECSALR
jgi:TPR repeat protein